MKSVLNDVRFSHVVATALLSVLTVVTIVTIGSIYFVSRLAVEEDISLIKKKSDAIAQLLVSSRKAGLGSAIDSAVQSDALQKALQAQDSQTLDEILTAILYTKQQGHLDFLYIRDHNSPLQQEISDHPAGNEYMAALVEASPTAEYSSRIFARPNNGATLVAITTKRHIISADTGEVLGDLTGGIFMNRNNDLLREFQELSGAQRSALLFGDQIITANPSPDWISSLPKTEGGQQHHVSLDDRLIFDFSIGKDGAGTDDLSLVSEQSVQVVEQLATSFLKVIAVVVVAILLTTLIATRVILNFSMRALDTLTRYSEGILSGARIKPFQGSRVREFNVVGSTLEHVAGALKDSEGRFRDFADCGADWFWETDQNGTFTFMDGKTVDIIGLEPEELLGKNRKQIRVELSQEAVPELSALDDVMAKQEPIVNFEASWGHPDGRTRYVLLNARPVLDEDGEFIGYRGVGRDISARKAAAFEAVRARQHAEEASQAKSHFLASMSHELRTPLNAIIGFSELLMLDSGKTLTDSQKDYLNSILTGGRQLLGLVDQVLDLAAIEDQRIDVHFQETSLTDLVAECVALVDAFAETRGVTIENRLQPGSMPAVRTDPVRLRQIVINLLNNAVKFNRENGSVTIEATQRPGGVLRLFIADTGIGIPAEDRETIFRLFGSLHRDSFTATESYGIGLAVSKQLAAALEGDLDFDSEVGEGSTFWVDIPCAERQVSAA
ncbi:ATP-binding protein [Hwanghaeella sp.]|uniref:ATP-binding protein n=1 Tax=Hwanghaeella sp. TaxID=2605943 RepID=UPI003CCBAED4